MTMKRFLLFILGSSAMFSYGQKINENRVTFNYIQLPTNPISENYNTFKVLVERKYEQANQDSLVAYQTRLDQATVQYDAQVLAWKEQNKVIERTYLQSMSTWQKNANAGTVAAQPVSPIYPPQPVMANIESPKLHSDVLDDQVSNAISIAGYDRGEGGAIVTIGILPVSAIRINMVPKGEGAAKKYYYTATYQMPVEIKVEDPTSGVVLQTIILNSMQSKNLNTYASQYDFDLWWIDNKESFWKDLETGARTSAYTQANDMINNKCGFPVRSWTAEVYDIKNHKDHDYFDLTNAYTIASQGYQMISQSRDRKAAAGKLNEAITIWKQALTESNVNDNKSRINDKATAMLQTNIALAYIWLSEFDLAEQYLNLAINSGVGKFKRIAEDLKRGLTERRLRWNTNFN